MKFFLAFLAIFAAASAQEDCELCKMGVDALGKYLSTEAEIAAVEEGRMTFLTNSEYQISPYLNFFGLFCLAEKRTGWTVKVVTSENPHGGFPED